MQDNHFINFRVMFFDLVGHQDVADCLIDWVVEEVIDLIEFGDEDGTVVRFQDRSVDGETVCGVTAIADICLGVAFNVFPLSDDHAFLEGRRLDENGEVDAGVSKAAASVFAQLGFFV